MQVNLPQSVSLCQSGDYKKVCWVFSPLPLHFEALMSSFSKCRSYNTPFSFFWVFSFLKKVPKHSIKHREEIHLKWYRITASLLHITVNGHTKLKALCVRHRIKIADHHLHTQTHTHAHAHAHTHTHTHTNNQCLIKISHLSSCCLLIVMINRLWLVIINERQGPSCSVRWTVI